MTSGITALLSRISCPVNPKQLRSKCSRNTTAMLDMPSAISFTKRATAFGASACIVFTPCLAYAAGSDKISGSADAPSKEELKDAEDKQPPGFKYTHLWTSKDGETHIKECEMEGFMLKSFAEKGAPQFVKPSSIKPDKISFTQLPPGTVSPMHSCPGTQWVVDMSGSWYVKTSDGTKRVFQPGEVMFQDNVKDSPADKPPQHESGTVGSEPCNQMVLQVDRAPEVDKPGPF